MADAASRKVSARGREIAELLAQVSNPTIPKTVRWDIADTLAWELGEGMETRDAGQLGEQARIALGWSRNGNEAAQQIRSRYEPNGVKPKAVDWLREAGLLNADDSENLPDRKRSALNARARVRKMLDDFCRAHGVPPVSPQEIADDRKPYVD